MLFRSKLYDVRDDIYECKGTTFLAEYSISYVTISSSSRIFHIFASMLSYYRTFCSCEVNFMKKMSESYANLLNALKHSLLRCVRLCVRFVFCVRFLGNKPARMVVSK